VHTPTAAATTQQQQGQDDMEVDGADITVTQKDEGVDTKEDGAKVGSPGDSSLDEDEEKEVERARPARGLRNRKAPVLAPLEIPVAAATSPKSSRKGKGHKGLFHYSLLSFAC
jgi:hypothetical protein